MNSAVLVGRLTSDPELRYIPNSETAVGTFTLAVDRPFSKDKEKKADFIRITVFGKTAENCERFIVKGSKVAIQGRITTGSYKDKEGRTIYTTEVTADRVEFLDNKKDNGNDGEFKQTPGIPEGFQALEDDDDIPF